MPGRTRLYQRAGSPLIHGHSRFERPGWKDWLVACAASIAVVYAVYAAAVLAGPAAALGADAVDTWVAEPLLGVGAAAAGAAGTWIARAFGVRRAWLVGAACGAAAGIAALVWGSSVL